MRSSATLSAVVPATLVVSLTLPLRDQVVPPPSLAGQEVQRIEVRANAHTSSTQEAAALDRDAAGRSVVAWQSKRQEADGSYGIYARRFDALGNALGEEVHVNLNAAGSQVRPAVALAPSGAAWFAWESHGQDGDRGGIVVRRFDPALEHSTNEILADTERSGHQAEPALAVDAEGRALVVWAAPVAGSAQRVIRARRFAPDGTPLGEPAVLSEVDQGLDRLPTVVANPTGGFQVAWSRADPAGVPTGILARSIDAQGALSAQELVVAEGRCVEPTADAGANGDFLVGWLTARGGEYVSQLRRVRGGELGPLRTFETDAPGHTSGYGVGLRDDGTALIAWSRYGDEAKQAGLFARELGAELEALGEAFRITGAVAGHQRLGVGGARRMRFGQDGTLAVAWDGAGTGGDSSGVNLTLLVPESVDLGTLAARSAPVDPVELEPEGAAPHEPPVFTGEVDLSGLLAAESLAGPDYGFLGITQTSLTPPDPHVAVGPNHVVCIVNGRMTFYEKDGTQTFTVATDGSSGFWASLGAANGFIFDPEVLYDPHSDRFMAMLNERNGSAYFLFAVSDDSDPNGVWHKYRFNATTHVNDTDIDSPNFAVDDTAVYLTADFFGPDKFLVMMVDKAAVLIGAPNPTETSLVITGQQSIGVPVNYDAGAPAQYMVEAFESSSNTQLRLHAITDPLGNPQRQTIDITVPLYEQPENPPQLGTSSRPETFEARFWSCMYRNGSLWATHHVNSSHVRQRWYEIAMNGWPGGGTPTVAQVGEVVPGEGVRTFFGSIWADDDGNAGLVFARSSSTEFISMSRVFRQASDPLGTMTPAQVMQQSTAPTLSGRWGDYSGVVADPFAPGAFWGYAEYITSGAWATWVGLMGPCATPIPYCTAKTTSIGSIPSIGSTGQASVSTNDLQITMTGGLPGKNGLMFWSLNPGAAPFMGGTKCALAPIRRTPVFSFDGSGNVSRPVSVTLDDLGETRYHQFWFRDPMHTDGTTVGLSDALQLTVCP